MLLSVIIPTCDRPETLKICLDALDPRRQTLGQPFETIVTDDGLETAELLVKTQYPWARWVKGPRKGPAANRNNGATFAAGDWLAFTDDDCEPRPDWLERYLEAFRANPAARAFEGAIHPRGDTQRDLAECPVNLTGGWFWSANICVQRELFEALKGFDLRFRIAAHEDQDLFLRIKHQSVVPFVSGAIVFHPVRYLTLRQSLRDLPKRSLNWLQYAKAHSRELEYHGNLGIIAAGYRSQVMAAYQALKGPYPRQFCRALAMLVYGMPLITYHLLFVGNGEAEP